MKTILMLTGLIVMAGEAAACSVCFVGDTNPNVILGVKSAIIVLLAGLVVVMAALIKFFITVARRSKQAS